MRIRFCIGKEKQMSKKTPIGITMGDPAGIGLEVIFKSLEKISHREYPIVLLGHAGIINAQAAHFKSRFRFIAFGINKRKALKKNEIWVMEPDGMEISPASIKWGKNSPLAGRISYASVELGISLCLNGQLAAVVTAPIAKTAWQAAGLGYTGHTELLGDRTHTKRPVMLFVNGPFKVALATIHTPLAQVPGLITRSRLKQTIQTAALEMKNRFGIRKPHILVAGLNPHAGEDGILGVEEKQTISPVVRDLQQQGWSISGPMPPDTIFLPEVATQADLIIAMYHDQGLIPFKMLALHQGVNVTAGLPIIRTSPDHGTAFNIAGRGEANPGSMLAAIQVAREMIQKSRRLHA
jgi:4-hydroxythreonine-4-phosphate dehydrogenase